MLKEVPIKRKRGRANKYDWNKLTAQGWLFVAKEEGHKNQGCSIRAAARHFGLRVSAVTADLAGVRGLMVELSK